MGKFTLKAKAASFLVAGFASLSLLGLGLASSGTALASTSAHSLVKPAETASCGTACTDVYLEAPGLNYVTYSGRGLTTNNNLVELFSKSDSRPGEDFIATDVGTVNTYCDDGLLSVKGCVLLKSAGLKFAPAWQLQYSPYGVASGKCLGIWDGAGVLANGVTAAVRLEPCGVNAGTVQILASDVGGLTADGGGVFDISGASNNFSDPEVLTSAGEAVNSSILHWAPARGDDGVGVDTQSAFSLFGYQVQG